MPVASPDAYLEMLDRAKSQKFAYPAINVSSSSTAIAALQGLQQAGSDGILQVSTGGAEYWSGASVKSMAIGAQAMAAFVREAAKGYGITVALHTDHCAKHQLDGFVRPLLEISAERVKSGQEALFNSHMWDGSAVPLTENLEIAKELLAKSKNVGSILEIEVGVVGGEEEKGPQRPVIEAEEPHDDPGGEPHADANHRLHHHEAFHRIGDPLADGEDPRAAFAGERPLHPGLELPAAKEQEDEVAKDEDDQFRRIDPLGEDKVEDVAARNPEQV